MTSKINRISALANVRNRRILFGALNWGMGHVSRSIPLIASLLEQENRICIACNPAQETIYRVYFPHLTYYSLEDYPFLFSEKGFRPVDFLRRIPQLFRHIQREKVRVTEVVGIERIDLVISDHRYGFLSSKVESIFITHQCRLPLPPYGRIFQFFHRNLMRKFNACWIADDQILRLAGKLSCEPKMPHVYLGVLSRFSVSHGHQPWKVLLLNGPEAFHTLLIRHFEQELHDVDYAIGTHPLIPEGIPQITNWEEADEILKASHTVISFCGYSTLMDMQALQCHWITLPTPGQYEQEYLFQQKTLREGGFHNN
ncbi:MAG: hypothetical protein EBU82_11975 [Flavobacteriia bacterium]|nr:hypothetical protein [Flavobacteriia bacterium]